MAWFGETLGEGLSSLKGQISKITKEVLTDDGDDIISLQEKIKELSKKCQTLEDDCLRKDTDITELKEERNNLKDALEDIDLAHQKELEVILKDRDELRNNVQLLKTNSNPVSENEKIKELEREVKLLRSKLKEYEDFNGFYNVPLQAESSSSNNDVIVLEQEKIVLINQLKESNKEMDSLRIDIVDLKNQLEQSFSELNINQMKLKDVEAENRTLKEQLIYEKENIESACLLKLDEEKATQKQLEEIVESLENKLSKEEAIRQQLESVIEQLRNDLSNITQEYDEKLNNEKTEEILALSNKYDNQIKELSETIVQCKLKNNELSEINSSLKHQIEKTTIEVSTQSTESDENKTTLVEEYQLKINEILQTVSHNEPNSHETSSLKIPIDHMTSQLKNLVKEALQHFENEKLTFNNKYKSEIIEGSNIELKNNVSKDKHFNDFHPLIILIESLVVVLKVVRTKLEDQEKEIETLNIRSVNEDEYNQMRLDVNEKSKIIEKMKQSIDIQNNEISENSRLITEGLKNIGQALGMKLSDSSFNIPQALSEINLRLLQIVEENKERSTIVKNTLHLETQRLKALVDRIRREFLLQEMDVSGVVESFMAEPSGDELCQTDDVKQLTQDFAQMTEIIRLVDQGLTGICHEKAMIEKELAVLKSVSAKTEKELHDIAREKDLSEQEIKTSLETIKNLKLQLQNLNDENNQLRAELSTMSTNAKEMKRIESILLEENKKLSSDLQGMITSDDFSSLNGKYTLLLNEKKQLEEQLIELKKISDSSEESNKLKDSLERLLCENSDLKQLVQQLREGIVEINNQHRSQSDEPLAENALRKELERLRAHLVEVEDHYTSEALEAEKAMGELKAKLDAAEEALRNSSNKYKSANVRSSQHVESLESQIRLMSVQRDDLQARLSASEDDVQRHVASLASLQMVLEQFQLDKEREIEACKTRWEYQIELARRSSDELQKELEGVREQLLEARSGLQAAARLGEKIERKNERISQLETELTETRNTLRNYERRVEEMSRVTSERIDKSLVKNLLLGYITATQPNHKEQGLKILASVLDVTSEERMRLGLDSLSTGWFSSFLHPRDNDHKMDHTNESLSQAFIRFLENESKPKPQIPLLPRHNSKSAVINNDAGAPRKSPLLVANKTTPTPLQDMLKEPETG